MLFPGEGVVECYSNVSANKVFVGHEKYGFMG